MADFNTMINQITANADVLYVQALGEAKQKAALRQQMLQQLLGGQQQPQPFSAQQAGMPSSMLPISQSTIQQLAQWLLANLQTMAMQNPQAFMPPTMPQYGQQLPYTYQDPNYGVGAYPEPMQEPYPQAFLPSTMPQYGQQMPYTDPVPMQEPFNDNGLSSMSSQEPTVKRLRLQSAIDAAASEFDPDMPKTKAEFDAASPAMKARVLLSISVSLDHGIIKTKPDGTFEHCPNDGSKFVISDEDSQRSLELLNRAIKLAPKNTTLHLRKAYQFNEIALSDASTEKRALAAKQAVKSYAEYFALLNGSGDTDEPSKAFALMEVARLVKAGAITDEEVNSIAGLGFMRALDAYRAKTIDGPPVNGLVI